MKSYLMKLSRLRAALRPIRKLFSRDPNRFLRKLNGVIHVGANSGQERERYEKLGLNVLWIEPIPSVYTELKKNISKFPRQQAIQALVTDRDNEEYKFHIANNEGASSSIFELNEHKDIWPNVEYTETISLLSMTLSSLLEKHNIDGSLYDGLIMDTQGSELLVLKGAEPVFNNFKVMQTEVADFESYTGCCRVVDVDQFMEHQGFRESSRKAFARRDEGGTYYDITYTRK